MASKLAENFNDLFAALGTHVRRSNVLSEKLNDADRMIANKEQLSIKADILEEMSENMMLISMDYARMAQNLRDAWAVIPSDKHADDNTD